MVNFQKAKRKKLYSKIAIAAQSGAGKTFSSLLLAKGMAGNWDKVAFLDTENESALLYAENTKHGYTIGSFIHAPISPPYHPNKVVEAVKWCEENGIEVLIIDSLSHFWAKEGGLLEMAEKSGGFTGGGWRKVAPIEKAMWDSILNSKLHIIGCMRTETDYVVTVEEDKSGRSKTKVEKVGTKPTQRKDFEYEFSVVLNLNQNSTFEVSKDRTGLFEGRVGETLTPNHGKELAHWLGSGVDPLEFACSEIRACSSLECVKAKWSQYKEFQEDEVFMNAKDEMKEKLSKNAVA